MNIKKNIFIVDDISENLQVIGNILKEKNVNISFARNGEQALAGISKKKPDLILLDITMPDMNGYKVCETLKSREETRDIPIIFLTARVQSEDIVRGFRVGAVDYITKPFNSEELIARVFTHLELKEARDMIALQNIRLKEKNEELYRESITDRLTEIYNRSYVMDALSKEFSKSSRHSNDLACLLFDIDHFKKCNDCHGHQAGDAVLSVTAKVINSLIRNEDYLGRYGGEEFLLLLPQCNGEDGIEVAEKIRKAVEDSEIRYDSKPLKVTISVGISDILSDNPCSDEELLHNADKALYRAKAMGRNRVVHYRNIL